MRPALVWGWSPAQIACRTQVCHWESDILVGPTRAGLVVAVERVTGYAVIGELAAGPGSAVVARFGGLVAAQPRPVRTITADNGREMTSYRWLERALSTRFNFTPPYTVWQPGSIELLNGLMRSVYHKGTDFTMLT